MRHSRLKQKRRRYSLPASFQVLFWWFETALHSTTEPLYQPHKATPGEGIALGGFANHISSMPALKSYLKLQQRRKDSRIDIRSSIVKGTKELLGAMTTAGTGKLSERVRRVADNSLSWQTLGDFHTTDGLFLQTLNKCMLLSIPISKQSWVRWLNLLQHWDILYQFSESLTAHSIAFASYLSHWFFAISRIICIRDCEIVTLGIMT